MSTIICRTEQDESAGLLALRSEWYVGRTGVDYDNPIVWFNGRSFDGPVIETRCRLLGHPIFGFDLRKYGSRNTIDLYADLTFNGDDCCAVMSRSQKALAARFGINGHDESSGADVAGLVAAGDYDAVAAHCQADLDALAQLYTRLYGDRPALLVDVETAPIANASDYRAYIKADGRLSDPKKIDADIDNKLAKAGLDPYLCRIVVIGYQRVNEVVL